MSSTALSLSNTRGSASAFLTPAKSTPPHVTDSPGNWEHPRIKEITRRQNASVFTSHNVKTIIYNFASICIVQFLRMAAAELGPQQLRTAQAKQYGYLIAMAMHVLPLLNIGLACLPLIRSKDDLSDIPLTTAQRTLLGLSPSSALPTPNSAYSTPPRYSRTPSINGSGGKPSPTSSQVSASGSPASPSRAVSPYSPAASPLLQKALGYSIGPRTSMYGLRSPSYGPRSPSFGLQSPSYDTQTSLNASTSSFNLSTGSSIFSEPPPTPSPIGGKRISVGLNNKWLYDRSRRSSGNVWP